MSTTALPSRLKQGVNNAAHRPWGAFLLYHIWWLLVALLHAPLSLVYLVLSAIWESMMLLTGFRGGKGVVSRSERGMVAEQDRAKMVVAITGCDTGFGHGGALELTKRGFKVFAGCLRPDNFFDAPGLNALEVEQQGNLTVLPLDVTNDSSVTAFATSIQVYLQERQESRLHAVINNAGVGQGGAIDWLDLLDFQRDMDVNYFGMVRVTKALLLSLKQSAALATRHRLLSPRVINVTSMAGLMPVPFMSPYCSSKHAAEAFSTCLRTELLPWGVNVVTMNPSFHQTPLVAAGEEVMRHVFKRAEKAKREQYGEDYISSLVERSSEMLNSNNWEMHNVVTAMANAVTLRYPPSQMIVGLDAKTAIALTRQIPSWLQEMLQRYQFKVHAIPLPAAVKDPAMLTTKKIETFGVGGTMVGKARHKKSRTEKEE